MQAGDDCSLAQFWRVLPSLRRSDIGLGVDASGGRTATLLGWLITAVVALVFDADVLHAGCLDVGEGGGVSVVAVDSHERGAFGGGDVVEDDVAFAHGLAVTARAIEFSEISNCESAHAERASAVVLKNFVSCTEGTTALDGGGSAGRLLFDGESILADLRPPDVGQGTASEAVNALNLVGTDDDVAEGSSFFEVEDSIG